MVVRVRGGRPCWPTAAPAYRRLRAWLSRGLRTLDNSDHGRQTGGQTVCLYSVGAESGCALLPLGVLRMGARYSQCETLMTSISRTPIWATYSAFRLMIEQTCCAAADGSRASQSIVKTASSRI